MDCNSDVYAKKLVTMMKKESALTLVRFVTFLKEKGHDVQELADEFTLQDAKKPTPPPKKPRVARAKKQDTSTDASEILKKDEFVC
jgi:hypothetical protein